MDDYVVRHPLLDVVPEIIKDVGCYFHVYRKRVSSHVFTTAMWKSNVGYVFNLANSLIWWANNLPLLFPGYNIRVYFDNSIFYKQSEDTTEWKKILNHLLTFDNIELWFYNCILAKSNKCIGCHRGTFGSMIRFHAFDDPDTEVIICHNLEYLTSPRDKERTEAWLKSRKRYHWYVFWGIDYQYGNILEDNNMPTIIATFSARKKQGESYKYFSVQIENKYRNYPFGIDEYILTNLVKNKMDIENTFVTDCLQFLYVVYELFPDELTSIAKQFIEYRNYSFTHINDFFDIISSDPDKGAEFVLLVRKALLKVKTILDKDYMDKFEKEFHEYFFKNLKDGNEYVIPKEFIYDYIKNVDEEVEQKNAYNIIYYFFSRSIINCIDFPGYCIKEKDFGNKNKQVDTYFHEKTSKIYNLFN